MFNGSGIVDGARRGDIFAFLALVERYQMQVFRYLLRLTGNAEQARRLTLQTFLRAHSRIKRLDTGMRFETWLYRQAEQTATSALRWQGLRRRRPASAIIVEDDREAQAMQNALLSLPRHTAATLLLSTLGGLSYDEVAQAQGGTVRRVRDRIGEARQRLSQALLARAGAPPAPVDGHATAAPLLSLSVDRQLPGHDQAMLDSHVARCAACQMIVADYQEIDRRMARLRNRGPSVSIAQDLGRVLRGDRTVVTSYAAISRRQAFAAASVASLLLIGGGSLALARRGRRGGLAGSGLLYIALQNADGQIAVVDVGDQRLLSLIPVGARPFRLAARRDGKQLFVLSDNGVISLIDTVQLVVTERYQAPGRPAGIALSPDGKRLYVTISDRRLVMLLDTETGRQVGEVRVGRTPREIIVSPDGQWLFVYNAADSTLSKIKSGAELESSVYNLWKPQERTTEFSSHPLALSPDGRTLYVSELNRERIWSIELGSDDVTSFDVPLRDIGRDLLVLNDGTRLLATHGDPRGNRSALAGLASLSLPAVERNAELRGFFHGVASNADGAVLFATNPEDNVLVFADAYTLEALLTLAVGPRPTAIVFAPKPRPD